MKHNEIPVPVLEFDRGTRISLRFMRATYEV
jgi:hypothetical protein